MQQSTTSRLGFRGNEDLGGGLSAQFQIEHRFNPDTGAQTAWFHNPTSWPVLERPQLRATEQRRCQRRAPGSRVHPGVLGARLKSDPFGNDGVGRTGVGITWAGYMTPDSASGVTTNPQAAWPAGWRRHVRSNTHRLQDPEPGWPDRQRRGGPVRGDASRAAAPASTSNTPRVRSTPASASRRSTMATPTAVA
ncbi:MAG: hypothetical protein MZW92_23655 [Comamonadaceae bacterium]|nr:hypothetical protein [Comamonadaceae bacterium]